MSFSTQHVAWCCADTPSLTFADVLSAERDDEKAEAEMERLNMKKEREAEKEKFKADLAAEALAAQHKLEQGFQAQLDRIKQEYTSQLQQANFATTDDVAHMIRMNNRCKF